MDRTFRGKARWIVTDSKKDTDAITSVIDTIVGAARDNLIRTFSNDGIVVVVGVLVKDVLSVKTGRNTELSGDGPGSEVLAMKVAEAIESYFQAFPKLSPRETKT